MNTDTRTLFICVHAIKMIVPIEPVEIPNVLDNFKDISRGTENRATVSFSNFEFFAIKQHARVFIPSLNVCTGIYKNRIRIIAIVRRGNKSENGISRRVNRIGVTIKERGKKKKWGRRKHRRGWRMEMEGSEFETKEEGRVLQGTAASNRAFNAKAALKPAVSTNVRNINLRELKPAYTS